MKSRVLRIVASVAVLVVTASLTWYAQQACAAEEFTREQIRAEFTGMLAGEAELMHNWLRVALKEPAPCGGPCNRDEDFARVVELLSVRCERMDPWAQERSPYYDAKLHGRDLGRLKSACAILRAGAKEHGKVAERPEWVEKARAAKAAFEK